MLTLYAFRCHVSTTLTKTQHTNIVKQLYKCKGKVYTSYMVKQTKENEMRSTHDKNYTYHYDKTTDETFLVLYFRGRLLGCFHSTSEMRKYINGLR